MANPWTPTGDEWPQPAMVMVKRVDGKWATLLEGDGDEFVFPLSYLFQPPPPAITPEQQAVLDAAVEYVRDREDATRGGDYTKLLTAVRAMLAAQQPVDPVVELRRAWVAYQRAPHVPERTSRMEAAIAALEAKS